MVATERHHKDTLQQMEHKFFEEKVLVLFHVVEHTVYVTCNVLVKNSGLFLTSCDDSVYVLCPNCQNTCQTNSLHWNTGCETCITQRLVYDYGQMVSGWNNNKVNTDMYTQKQTASSRTNKQQFSLFSFL